MITNDLALKLGDLGQVGVYTRLDFVIHPSFPDKQTYIAITKQPDESTSVYLENKDPAIREKLLPLKPSELTKKENLEEFLETIKDTITLQQGHDYYYKKTTDDLVRFEKLDHEKILFTLRNLTQRYVAYRVLESTNHDYLKELQATNNYKLPPTYNELAKLYYQGTTTSEQSIEKLQETRKKHLGHKKIEFKAAGIHAANLVRKTHTKQLPPNKKPSKHAPTNTN